MTPLRQTHQRTITAQDSRRRGPPVLTGSPEAASAAPGGGRPRQALPAVDPSSAFGCVDWFLYPDQATGRSAAEAYGKRIRA